MTNGRMLQLAILLSIISAGYARVGAGAGLQPHDGPVVTCNDGRRGILSGNAIIWPDGTRSSASPHPSVIIGKQIISACGTGRLRRPGHGRGAAGRSERAEQDALRHSRWRVVLLLTPEISDTAPPELTERSGHKVGGSIIAGTAAGPSACVACSASTKSANHC